MLFFIYSSCEAQDAPLSDQVLQHAKMHRIHAGVLTHSAGFMYVKIDDSYIYDLVNLIRKEGFEEPPYFGEGVGAHITVIYPDEMEGIQGIEECGKLIDFTPQGCQVVHPPRLPVDQVYFITVDAPDLDALREKYGLPRRQYDYHITIGVKPLALSARDE